MAYVQDTQGTGYESYQAEHPETLETSSNALMSLTNVAGAIVSIALIAGLCVWGYRLVQRDVSGIPVVQAAAGEMRVRPQDPGGQLAGNQGLAVNAVAAGQADKPHADTLVLAPKPPELSDEDLPEPTPSAAPVQQPAPLDVARALEDDDIDALVARLTDGQTPIRLTDDTNAAPSVQVAAAQIPATTLTDAAPQSAAIPASVPGPSWSSRPQVRPDGIATQPKPEPVAATPATAAVKEADVQSIPSGTRLVQLGAYDSEKSARSEWDRISGNFQDYFVGKERVIQKAQSGGRTFYRLRALGFADLSEARRFCSVLVAGKADCIPVVAR